MSFADVLCISWIQMVGTEFQAGVSVKRAIQVISVSSAG